MRWIRGPWLRIAFALWACEAAGAPAPLTADAIPTLRIARRHIVGERLHVVTEATRTLVRSGIVGPTVVSKEIRTQRLQLEATRTVTAVDDAGRETAVRYDVDRCLVTREGVTRPLLAHGRVIEVDENGGISLGGRQLSPEAASLLALLFVRPQLDDASSGGDAPRAIGARWPIDPAPFATAAGHDLRAARSQSSAEGRLMGTRSANGIDYVDLKFAFTLAGLPVAAPSSSREPGSAQGEFRALFPRDPAAGAPLEESWELALSTTGWVAIDGQAVLVQSDRHDSARSTFDVAAAIAPPAVAVAPRPPETKIATPIAAPEPPPNRQEPTPQAQLEPSPDDDQEAEKRARRAAELEERWTARALLARQRKAKALDQAGFLRGTGAILIPTGLVLAAAAVAALVEGTRVVGNLTNMVAPLNQNSVTAPYVQDFNADLASARSTTLLTGSLLAAFGGTLVLVGTTLVAVGSYRRAVASRAPIQLFPVAGPQTAGLLLGGRF